MNQKKTECIEQIAEETLLKFETIAEIAKQKLSNRPSSAENAFASINTITSSAKQNLEQISLVNRESYQFLIGEPAIARIVVAYSDGNTVSYYICRTTPVSGVDNLASYRAPVGRLASLEVGSEFTFPNGDVVEVLERTQLHPAYSNKMWDSRNTIVEVDDFGPITIESLRTLVSEASGDKQDEYYLDQLLAEDIKKVNIIEGVRRSVITKMGLRDQPILDKYQDEIFRLPLGKRLLILGPPGTGKTTTLIRRLGQKLDTEFLDDTERRIAENIKETSSLFHAESWLMFTPTELLKQYLKEAFNRENVPASDQRIKTWLDYRRDLARNTFGILRTAASTSGFILKDSASVLNQDAIDNPIVWFEDFYNWQRAEFVKDIKQSAYDMIESQSPEAVRIGERLRLIIQQVNIESLSEMFISLIKEVTEIQRLIASLKEITEKKVREALNLQLNRNKSFIDELVTFIDSLELVPEVETEELDDPDGDEEDVVPQKTPKVIAVNAYIKAVKANARATASKKSLGKYSRNGKIIEWLDGRGLKESDRLDVGVSLLLQAKANRFTNPVKRYMDGIPKRYRAFRRIRHTEKRWYLDNISVTDIHPLELDIVLLTILSGGNDLLSKSYITRDINLPSWSTLRPIFDLYKNQIMVDEVTDFSPIQIACMAALAQPRLRSFFACGDFNQRLTTWGSRSIEQLKWVFQDIDIREINVSYRQSRQLNELARAIIKTTVGSDQGVTLPPYIDSEGLSPVLLEGGSERVLVINWLAQRIHEIERLVNQLPSIAIFVDNEADVQPIAEALKAALVNENTEVIACTNGQVMGKDNAVRVFDIQHIKGLEFEAVFFISIDLLAERQPQLFDKYLYVGTTRAATYLGVTCEKELPAAIASLNPIFVSDWNNF